MFSFSTPHIHLKNEEYGDFLLGVGHTKIHADYHYQYKDYGPWDRRWTIENFRYNLYSNFKEQFGDKYIRHFGTTKPPKCDGYIYTMYFYILYNKDKDGNYQ